MASVLSILLVLGLCTCIHPIALDESTLQLVNIIVRHGARSPTNPFPKDKYKDHWPQGFGQLTKVGIQQMSQLGGYLKKQYQELLNDTYINDEFYVRSSNYDRTLMSAESFLAGMYPLTSPKGEPSLGWQPIPVHTVAALEDILLDVDTPVCPYYDKLKQARYDSEEFQTRNSSYEAYYQRLKDLTGKTNYMDPYGVWDVYDTIYAEETEKLPIPEWFTAQDRELATGVFIPWQFDIHFGTFEAGRLKGGPLIKDIIQNMQLKVNNTLSPTRRKAFFYIGHDNNIVTTMIITKTFIWRYLPYATYLAIELHSVDDKHFVRMVFQNSTYQEEPAVVLNITVCGGKSACPLEEFTRAVSPYFISVEEWNQLCSPPELSTLTLALIICVSISVAFILILIVTVMLLGAKVGQQLQHTSTNVDEQTKLLSHDTTSYRT